MIEFRLACLILAVSLAYVPGIPSGASAPKWWVLALGLVVVLWRLPRDGDFSGLATLVVFWVWCALGLLWTAAPWDTLEGLIAVTLLGIVFVLGGRAHTLDWCWEAAAIACWLQLPIILMQVTGHVPVTALGVSGLMFSKNMLAEFALAAGVGVLFTRSPWLVLGPLLCIVLLWMQDPAWELVLGGTTALVVFVMSQSKLGKQRYAVLALFVAALVVGVLAKTESLNDRLAIWDVTLSAALQYPFGWGLNSFADAVPGLEFAHNDLLQIFFELGVPGLALVGFVLWRSFSVPGGLAEKCVLAALLGCSLLWWPMRSPATAFIAAMALGYLCAYHSRARVLERSRRGDSSFGVQFGYQDLSPATVRAARAGCEVLPVRPQYPLVGREVSEHV